MYYTEDDRNPTYTGASSFYDSPVLIDDTSTDNTELH
jgi:hypothetical protein